VGDTVGDPFKDTTGPAINILIKLISYISVVLSPVFKNQVNYWWAALIIIGVLILFVPFWNRRRPKGLGLEERLEMVSPVTGGGLTLNRDDVTRDDREIKEAEFVTSPPNPN